ncbi:MAG: DNA recombination protein RmuC [Pseudomonadales bacterium]|nr:DNA recombination protein RmuC [Pseudomonadales bacterium]
MAAKREESTAHRVMASETQQKLVETKALYQSQIEQLGLLREKYDQVVGEYTEQKITLEEREASFSNQLANFEEQKNTLQKVFENSANKIFEAKNKTFSETSKTNIDSLLKPFREQIEGFQKRVNDIHDESIKGSTGLTLEIQKLLAVGLKMSSEANNLTSALKGDSQQRGAWGEAQLERTLEMSGLVADAHYEKQSSFKDKDGKNKFTDYLIKLPDNKHIIIDSKVSLVAYDRAISASTAEAEALALDEHAKAVRANIDDLAAKDYTNLIGVRSPSFVLMFIPIEPAYIEALKNQKDLFGYGYDRDIVLVSHTTLIPILRTVANLWMMERSNTEAQEISEKAGDIYNQVCVVAERMQKLGNSLGTVSKHYNSTVTSLVGQQGLHGKVERFKQISSKVSKSMPALEPSHVDFETERLVLLAEPLVAPTTKATLDHGELMVTLEPQADAEE